MFGNRQRAKRDPKSIPAFLTPQVENNSGASRLTSSAFEDEPSVPSAVTEIMSVIKLNWEFMMQQEVFV
jgi:hypothetical protein